LTSIDVNNIYKSDIKTVLKSTTCISKAKLNNIKDLLKKSKDQIWKNWDIEIFPLFLTVLNIPKESWNIQKHKFIKLIIENFDSGNSSFIVGFSGWVICVIWIYINIYIYVCIYMYIHIHICTYMHIQVISNSRA
jgi:hypothetical protein